MGETEAPSLLTVTESAAKRIAFLREQENQPNSRLRVSVTGGGCSGFQYGFGFDDTVNDDDTVIEAHGAAVVVDSSALLFLSGSQIDYVDDLIGAYFSVNNPNATATCGCGSSFAV